MVMLQLRLDGAVPLGIGRSSVGNLSCTSKSEALGQTDAPLELLKIGYGVPRLRPDSETLPDRGRWFVRSSFRKTSTREPSCTLRWTVWRPEIAAGASGLLEMVSLWRRDCVAFHALAIHGSGCGRRVSVLESWTFGSMRRRSEEH